MGVSVANLRVRVSMPNTVASLVESFNTLTEALLSAGMLPVSLEEDPGQVGVFTTGPAGPGQTSVPALAATNGATYVGYRVFKHPLEALWLKINYIDFGFGTTTNRAAHFLFQLGESLGTPGGALGNSVGVPNNVAYPTSAFGLSVITANLLPLAVSCGPGHLWVSHVSPLVLGPGTSYPTYPTAPGVISLAWFKSGPAELLVGPAPVNYIGTTVYPISFTASSTKFNLAAVAYRGKPGPGMPWQTLASGAAGQLIDPGTPSSQQGVRLGRAGLHLDGVHRNFNFGFVNSGAVPENTLLTCDLGEGVQKYRTAHSFGPANPSFYLATASDLSCLILPWAE